MESRPVISACRKRMIVAQNKLDHIQSGLLPLKKTELPESARFHASVSGSTPRCQVPTHGRKIEPPLNLFAADEPPRRSASAPRVRNEGELFCPSEQPVRECRRKVLTPKGPPSQLFCDSSIPTRVNSPVLAVKKPEIARLLRGEGEREPAKWTARRASPAREAHGPTSRVIHPSEQDQESHRRGLCATTRPRDAVYAVLGSKLEDSFRETRPSSLRTKIPAFTFETPVPQRPSTNPRHVVAVPQPSTLFSSVSDKGGLCFWDYKFSSIKKPSPNSLVRRAATPDPPRIRQGCGSSIERSGKKHVLPPYLLA